ncbi:MAG: copper chaperone PCu(A)C [Candidatus Limnocylindrales bacterium]
MNRSARSLLLAGTAAAAALSLSLAPVMAQDDEGMADDMDKMEPMGEMEPGLYVMEPWARESPMMQLAGAAYMVIHNSTDADDALVGATSPAAEVVELHLSSMDDEGMMSMNQVTEIAIPAHADAVLEPGSYHLMLIDLVEPLTEGTEVELTLEFMAAEPQTVSAPVMTGPPMMGGMDMDEMDMDEMADGDGAEDPDADATDDAMEDDEG